MAVAGDELDARRTRLVEQAPHRRREVAEVEVGFVVRESDSFSSQGGELSKELNVGGAIAGRAPRVAQCLP